MPLTSAAVLINASAGRAQLLDNLTAAANATHGSSSLAGWAAASPPWWQPDSFGLALVVALVSTACWGSWSNTAKAAGSRMNFAHFYADFCLGTVLAALVFFAGPGTLHPGRPEVDLARCLFALAAGAVFGVANLLLTTGIALAGLSIAFPLCIGTGLVLGTVLTYLVDRRGQPALLFPGVFLALFGVLANAKAYASLQKSRQRGASEESPQATAESSEEESGDGGSASSSIASAAPSSPSAARNVVMCIIGGVLMGCWAPLSTKAMKGQEGLSPYFSFVCFTIASMAVGLAIIGGQQCGCAVMPRVGAITSAGEYFGLPITLHGWGLLGGSVWALGTVSNLVSGGPLGFALSYALGQTAPVVAVLWGLLLYHEFDGAPRQAVIYLAAMFLLFVSAITLLCLGGR